MADEIPPKTSANIPIRKDCIEILRRLDERNPNFSKMVLNGEISLDTFAEIIVVHYLAFHGQPLPLE